MRARVLTTKTTIIRRSLSMRQTTMEWIRSTHGDDQDHDDQVDEDDDNNNVADYDEAGADLHNG